MSPMNETRQQRMLREALGPDPLPDFITTARRVAFVFVLLAAAGLASALGTHDVQVVNGPAVVEMPVADVAKLAALISDASNDDR